MRLSTLGHQREVVAEISYCSRETCPTFTPCCEPFFVFFISSRPGSDFFAFFIILVLQSPIDEPGNQLSLGSEVHTILTGKRDFPLSSRNAVFRIRQRRTYL